MASARVVVTDHAFDSVDTERAVAAELGADFSEHQCRSEAETIEAVRGANAVLVNFAPITAAVLAELAPSAVVVRYGIGYDNVDVEAARAAGVAVANVPDYGGETVADHAVALLLTLLRRIPTYDRMIKTDGWCKPADVGPIRALSETTVGLVGSGRIGLAVAERLHAFGISVLAHDPFAGPEIDRVVTRVGFDELLDRSDAISLHCPLVPSTEHIIDTSALERLRPGAVLVNTSRGGLIDSDALATALQDGRLAGAALDVFEPEPLPEDSPLRLQQNVIFTPHAAFYSDASIRALQQLAADEVRRALRGEELRSRVA